MRRKDREIQDITEIFDMLNGCDTVVLGISGETAPYIVPVSFGAELAENEITIYFHSARQGLKIDLLSKNPLICVEGHRFLKTERTQHGITARYESVIGSGECRFLSREADILHGLRVLLAHYGYSDYPVEECMGLQHLLVGKIVLQSVSGKRNLPDA